MLRDSGHGTSALKFSGDIVRYEGVGTLKNTILLRFVKNRYKKLFITFDLDMKADVERSLASLGLRNSHDYLPIGIDAPGRRTIEGLLPESIHRKVYGENAHLVMAATEGTKEERESARNELKKLCLCEFKAAARPGAESFGQFYRVTKILNSALREQT
jgi:hypothetical protein